MLVAFSGVQGVGKSTLVGMMKKDRQFCNYLFCDEIVRKLAASGVSINENGDDETQRRVMQSHLDNLSKRFNASISGIVVDRCILDGFVYSKYLFDNGKITADTFQLAYNSFRNHYHLYDAIFYMKPEFDLVPDGVRSENKKFRDDISKIFDSVVKKYDIDVCLLTGSVEERYTSVLNKLTSIK